ncbi:MAG TPA: hypothetical protein VHY22_02415 [Chthoniobacteraceae bacterium]|jgi:hypothetical protein|nr:hypothetical protein [Chthoniobacteraceae bacterium]
MNIRSLLATTLLLGFAAIPAAFGADASASPSPAAKMIRFPFHGKVSAVDTAAMTFTISGKKPRIFSVTETTKIRKNGEAASLKDAAVNDDTGGYAEKDASGKLTALSVRFGPRTAAKTAANPAATTASASSSPAASPKPKARHLKKSKASPSPSATAS